jgi:hypothetical protein
MTAPVSSVGSIQLPRFSGVLGPVNMAMSLIERALGGVLRNGQEIYVPSVVLTASDGSSWRVTVDTNGQLRTTEMDRATRRR